MKPITDERWDPAQFRSEVQAVIDTVLAQERNTLAGISADLSPMMHDLTGLMSGGKRLRAAFCYWGWRAAADPDSIVALDAAMMRASASLEFLQACALIHDDVMDGSDTRRGLPAVHRSFQLRHESSQWTGSAELFGMGAAILLGDLCLAWADQLLFQSGLPDPALLRAKPVYDLMRTELMAGQYLDLLEQARSEPSIDRARTVVRFKSAKYTIERPLHLGAALAGGSPALVLAYSDFGLALGEAFQLRDDILGVFGDPSQTGKPAGDDLREGKSTVLVAAAFAGATPAQSARLRSALGNHQLSAADVTEVQQILMDTGAVQATELLITQGTDAAHAALAAAPISADGRAALTTLVDAATRRAH